jgi:hypothetical protein
LASARRVANLAGHPDKELVMKCLTAVVFASACGGAVPQPVAPLIEYPRGPHVLDNSGACTVSRIEHSINSFLICDSFRRR